MTDRHDAVSDEERNLLRESLRGYLAEHWPADEAVARASDSAAVQSIWRGLAAQGVASLGADPDAGGLREVLLAFEELGRAACPAPLIGSVLVNTLLRRYPGAPGADDALSTALARGAASVAVAFGRFDGDRAAGGASLANGAIEGRIAFVEGAASASHVLVLLDRPLGAAIVPADASGLTVTATPGLAVPAMSELGFSGVRANLRECPAGLLEDLALIARVGCAARAVGAAQRGFELAVEHAKVRRQFGQFIGQFQALQHKLADCLIRLDGARLTLDGAAAAYDRGVAEWRVFAAAALAFAGPMLRQVALETQHAMGAIGYAEEHELPRHFRRIHADLARFGGAPRARGELADYLLGPIASTPQHN